MQYTVDIDVCELVNIADVMEHMKLGPNGGVSLNGYCLHLEVVVAGLVFCMDYIEMNLAWLRERLAALEKVNSRTYLLIDFPGQVELFTHGSAVKRILRVCSSSHFSRTFLLCRHSPTGAISCALFTSTTVSTVSTRTSSSQCN